MAPQVTVIVAVLNAAETLDACIRSVVAQGPVAELVVVDGGSTDSSLETIKQHEGQLAYWHSRPDNGIYDAWNQALPHAKGHWILFLGADDELVQPNILEQCVEKLTLLGPKVNLAYGRAIYVDKARNVVRWRGQPWAEECETFWQGLPETPHGAMFHRRSIFDEGRRFDTRFRIAGDYDLLLAEAKRSEPHFLGDIVVTRVRIEGLSWKLENRLRALRESWRARRNNHIRGLPLLLYRAYAANLRELWRTRLGNSR